jgi:hypothetical protein
VLSGRVADQLVQATLQLLTLPAGLKYAVRENSPMSSEMERAPTASARTSGLVKALPMSDTRVMYSYSEPSPERERVTPNNSVEQQPLREASARSSLSTTSSRIADSAIQRQKMVQDQATGPPIQSTTTGKENGFASSDPEKGHDAPSALDAHPGRRRASTREEEEEENEREGDELDEPPLERAPSSARSQTFSQREGKRKAKSMLPLLSTISLLIFATIWGVLARLGLSWIGGFAEAEVFSLIWAQMVGCLMMGLVVERKKGLEKL